MCGVDFNIFFFGVWQVVAFVAPKIIGGKNAPSPVGELGMVEMSQALDLTDICYEQVGSDPYNSILFYFGSNWSLLLLFLCGGSIDAYNIIILKELFPINHVCFLVVVWMLNLFSNCVIFLLTVVSSFS